MAPFDVCLAPKADIQTDVVDSVRVVISTSKRGLRIMRYELSDYEWSVIKLGPVHSLTGITCRIAMGKRTPKGWVDAAN